MWCNFVIGTPTAIWGKFDSFVVVAEFHIQIVRETAKKNGHKSSKKGVYSSTSDQLAEFVLKCCIWGQSWTAAQHLGPVLCPFISGWLLLVSTESKYQWDPTLLISTLTTLKRNLCTIICSKSIDHPAAHFPSFVQKQWTATVTGNIVLHSEGLKVGRCQIEYEANHVGSKYVHWKSSKNCVGTLWKWLFCTCSARTVVLEHVSLYTFAKGFYACILHCLFIPFVWVAPGVPLYGRILQTSFFWQHRYVRHTYIMLQDTYFIDVCILDLCITDMWFIDTNIIDVAWVKLVLVNFAWVTWLNSAPERREPRGTKSGGPKELQ